MSEQLLYQIALAMIPGIGGISGRRLVAACGTAEAVFKGKRNILLKIPGVGEAMVNGLKGAGMLRKAEDELAFIRKFAVTVYFFTDPGYPERLKHCEDSPLLLFYKGTADLSPQRVVSVVGTRKPSDYGREICQDIIRGLAEYQVLVVSGLAYGIDTISHHAALHAEMKTIGVLGHGLDQIYPFTNRSLAEKMISCGGLLTEFPSGIKLNRDLFPRRNRIIAGMADATLVIESAEKGGALITADIANSYNRDVFAVPGRVTDQKSRGCNDLIRTNRAGLVHSAADLAYMMGWHEDPGKPGRQMDLFPALTAEEKTILMLLQERGESGIDDIYLDTGISAGTAAAALLRLEFEGMIRCLPGKRYRYIP